jgi:RNA polymerase sigma-70 factor (ECF subfamily)
VRSMFRETGGLHTPPTTDEDARLLARVQRGDEQAMAALYDRYARLVYSVALRVLRDGAAAGDLLQEIFLQLWRNPTAFRATGFRETGFRETGSSLGGWLTVVARNRSIDVLRRRRPQEPVEEVALAAACNLGEESERTLMMEKARGLVGLLPQGQRKTLEMAFFDGLTHAEIAEMTNEPLGTVKTRIRSALLALRKGFQS